MQNLLHLTNNEILHFTKKNELPTPLTKQNKLISNARTQPFATLVRRLGLLFGYLFPLLHALYVGTHRNVSTLAEIGALHRVSS